MASRFRTQYLVLASSVAVALIVCSYLFSGPYSFRPSVADAATAESLLKAYSTKDSDSDGLPDWQESLYGTDPANPQSFKAGVRDGDAVAQGLIKPRFESAQATSTIDVPGKAVGTNTLTAQFSQEFLKRYVAAGAGSMTAAQQQALITELLGVFSTKSAALLTSPYTSASVRTDAGVPLTAYAASVEQVILANNVPTDAANPVDLMDAYITNGDATAQPKLERLARSYDGIHKGLAQLRVPPASAQAHLTLMRSFDSLARATKLTAHYEDDPVAALGGLTLYQPLSLSIIEAFKVLSAQILAEGTPKPGAAGSIIVNFAQTSGTP